MEGSRNIVMTRNRNYKDSNVTIVHYFDETVTAAKPTEKIYVIGGADIFRMAMKSADRIEVSRIDRIFSGADVFFPEFSEKEWTFISSKRHEADKRQ